MAKPIVSTAAGVNGLDLTPGEDFLLAGSAEEFAGAIQSLLADPHACARLGAAARRRVEHQYNWDGIARAQMDLYGELLGRELIGADHFEERPLLERR